MGNGESIQEVSEAFELYDRGVESIEETDAGVKFVLSMFHCDDPMRSDESKDYTLTMSFNRKFVKLIEGNLFYNKQEYYGKILETKIEPDGVILGIEWQRHKTLNFEWCKIKLLGLPNLIEEAVTSNLKTTLD